jgi:peptide/nickel transport system substrate-binding protein
VSGLGVRIAEAIEVKARWEGTRNRVIADRSTRLRVVEIQFRPEYGRPINGLMNRTVRQGLYQAINRAELATTMLPELGTPADSWFRDTDALRPLVEDAIPRFPYDPAPAAQLLAEAGWTPGGDGVLVHQPSGERFDLEIWNTESSGAEKETSIVASFWKAAGVNATLNIIPAARIPDREYRSKLPGVGLSGPNFEGFYIDRLHSKDATSAANRWTGSNRGGYSNPRVDTILDRLAVTIGRDERIALHRDRLREQMGDVAAMPLYWDIDVVLVSERVSGVLENATGLKTWNIHQWAVT